MNISLIMTVRNEERGITELLRSAIEQSRSPDEIVVVDGGSVDCTIHLIEDFLRAQDIPYKLLVAQGTNIAEGRNIAVRNAAHDFIAVTDGGCVLHPEWLHSISKPFDDSGDIDAVFGMTIPVGDGLIGQSFAALYRSKVDRANLAVTELSSRSVMFKKAVWKELNGYPEWLSLAGEDTYFFRQILRSHNATVARSAIVYWHHNYEDLRAVFRAHYRYSRGSGEAMADIGPHIVLGLLYVIGTGLLAAGLKRPVCSLLALTLAAVYLSKFSLTAYADMKTRLAFLITPIMVLSRECGMILGYIHGLSTRYLGR